MSTLTSSSPAASPRVSGYSQYRSSRPTRSPASRIPPSPPLYSTGARSSEPANQPLQQSPRLRSTHQYADAGTQYSPEGYPPTSSKGKAAVVSTPSSKRKHTSPDVPPSMRPPSSTEAIPSSPPPKPLPRDAPAKAVSSVAPNTTSHEPAESAVSVPSSAASPESTKKIRTDSRGLKMMPRKYETCDSKDLGILIADMLMELIRLNDKIPLKDGKLTRFHSRAPPGISCHDYLQRLIQHATLSPPILLSMVYYIDRLCALYPIFTISSLTVHRFLITAATVASKGLSDSFWTNPTYARIGGISTSELATLELEFLQRVEFRIVPKPETLVDYYVSLVQRSSDYLLEGDSSESSPGSDRMDQDPP